METGANAPFSIIFSKVFKTLLKFFLGFFHCYLKIENDVMIKDSLLNKGLNAMLT